ncbi:MAG: hypothetical protein PVI90_02550 [Desulfobacteraceae bacterium]|jgi:hypothetical protein
MSNENCPECGHLLSNSKSECPFCAWRQEDAMTIIKLNRHDPEPDYYYDEIRPDQLPGY